MNACSFNDADDYQSDLEQVECAKRRLHVELKSAVHSFVSKCNIPQTINNLNSRDP